LCFSILIALLVMPLPLLASAQQQGQGEGRKGRAWARKNEIDDLTAKKLQKVQKLFAEEDLVGAKKALDRFRVRSMNALERLKFYSWRGYVAYALGDLSASRDYFEKALLQGTATQSERENLRFTIAQICLQESDWSLAVENLERWFEIASAPSATAYYLLALAYWQLSDMDGALEPAERAVALTQTPQENWLQLLLGVYLTRKDYAAGIPVLDALVRSYPKKLYWIQLSTLHGAMGNYEQSLIPLQFAHAQGMITDDEEIRKLAELLLFLELPIRAVDVMQEGLAQEQVQLDSEFYELLSNGLIMAREYDRAVTPLTQAAELDEGGGRIYLRLAEVHIQRERWAEATEALGKAIERGDLPDPGQAELLMGIAFYSQKRPGDAVRWFVRAKRFAGTEGEASVWLDHITRERSANTGV